MTRGSSEKPWPQTMWNDHLYLAVVANIQLRVQGEGSRVLAPLGVAGVPASWPEASTAHQGVINVTHHLQQYHFIPMLALRHRANAGKLSKLVATVACRLSHALLCSVPLL